MHWVTSGGIGSCFSSSTVITIYKMWKACFYSANIFEALCRISKKYIYIRIVVNIPVRSWVFIYFNFYCLYNKCKSTCFLNIYIEITHYWNHPSIIIAISITLHKICENTGFHWYAYSQDTIVDSVLMQENMGHWKPVFSHILYSVNSIRYFMKVADNLQFIWIMRKTKKPHKKASIWLLLI